MKNDVESFEMGPHRMRWIRQTPVGECIGRKQVTEIILKRWRGLVAESRRLRAQLRAALEAVEEVEDAWPAVKAPEAEAA